MKTKRFALFQLPFVKALLRPLTVAAITTCTLTVLLMGSAAVAASTGRPSHAKKTHAVLSIAVLVNAQRPTLLFTLKNLGEKPHRLAEWLDTLSKAGQ